ncbi:MAG: hypothetical protein EWM47_12590, partial [Anaerolineaceae bacterium]
EDGKLIRKIEAGFITTDDGTYYVDESGIILYGWQEIGGSTYYFSTLSGYMRTGRTYIDGGLYDFAEDGKLIRKVDAGFITTDEGTYYVDESGNILYGWQEIGGFTYYFSTTNGYMRTGRTYIDGELYDFAEDGKLIRKIETGFITTDVGTYYVNENGIILYGWQELGGETYYFSTANGYMRTGRTYIGGELYDFTEDGKLIRKVEAGFITTDGGTYYVNGNGNILYGWQQIGESTYYFSTANGYMRTGRAYVGGILYDFAADGKLIRKVEAGFITTDLGTYYVNENGNLLYGWHEINGSTYYFSTANGYMRTGRTYIGGELYDFAEDGKLIGKVETGFITTDGGTYYVDESGNMLYGWHEIGGSTYYFSTANGFMRTGRTYVGGILYDFADDGKLIGEVMPDVPETGGSETDGSETDGSETDGSETDGSETDGSETDGPETDGPETDGSETDGPETDGSETDGSETDGSETDGPETDGSETDGPETDGTETDGSETDGSETDGTETDGPETDGPELDDSKSEETELDDTAA